MNGPREVRVRDGDAPPELAEAYRRARLKLFREWVLAEAARIQAAREVGFPVGRRSP